MVVGHFAIHGRMATHGTAMVAHPSSGGSCPPITRTWSSIVFRGNPCHPKSDHDNPMHCNGRPWSSVVTHDNLWAPWATHGSAKVARRNPWWIMTSQGTAMVFSWSSVATYGIAFVTHGNPWSLMVSCDTAMVVHGNPWSLMETHGTFIVVNGHPWQPKSDHGVAEIVCITRTTRKTKCLPGRKVHTLLPLIWFLFRIVWFPCEHWRTKESSVCRIFRRVYVRSWGNMRTNFHECCDRRLPAVFRLGRLLVISTAKAPGKLRT